MYSQRTGPCDECDGKGQSMDPSKLCKTCSGKKIKKESKVLKVEIDKGSPNGERYTVHGEGDQVPDVEPGDVIVQIREKKHKTF
jgi:DnaJ-class molecular chaperone